MDAKKLITVAARNLLLAAVVFLPVFLLASFVELKIRGVAFSEPVSYHLSGSAVAYLGLLAPVLLGAIVHSAGVLLIPSKTAGRTRQVVVVALASLLPFTVILSGLAPIFLDFLGPVVIATFTYGLACAARVGQGPAALLANQNS